MTQVKELYPKGDYKGLLALSVDSLAYAENTDNKKAASRASFFAGIVHITYGEYDQAEAYFQKGKALASAGVSDKYYAECEFRLGIIRFSRAEYNQVPAYYFNALGAFEKLKDSANMALVYDKMGDLYSRLNDDQKTSECYQKSYDLYTIKKDEEGRARSMTSLAGVLSEKRKFKEADVRYKQAEVINLHLQREGNLEVLFNNMALNYEVYGRSVKKQNPKMADSLYHLGIDYYHKSATLKRKNKGEKALASYYRGLAVIYVELNNLKKAEACFDSCLAMSYKVENKSHRVSDLKAFRSFVMQMAQSETVDIHLKETLWKKVHSLDTEISSLRDSIYNEINVKAVAEASTRYQAGKKDVEIANQKLALSQKELQLNNQAFTLQLGKEETAKQKAQNELLISNEKLSHFALSNQNEKLKSQKLESKSLASKLELERKDNVLKNKDLKEAVFLRNSILLAVLVLIVIGWLVFNSIRLRRKVELQKAVIDQRKRLSADLHDDIGATLSSISIYTEAIKNKLKNNEPEKVMELITKIGENSRETISTLGDIVWNINPQNDSAEKLFNRMESTATMLLSAQNTLLEFEADPRLSDFDFSLEAKQNLYLIFKETINNTLKYADATQVKIGIKKADGNFEMAISDNGKGFDSSKESEGNGLKNMKRRVENFGGKFMLASSSAGTSTMVQIPVVALEKI